ncbi:MAG: hypothetical protein IKP76_02585 [Bacilli bacterium]|nr:hypothetical protein [Bacilli bacterium]
MKNVLKTMCVLSLAVLLFAGCDKKVNNNSNNGTTTVASKGNCTVFECLNKIEATNTIEEINGIIGFEGRVKEESAEDSSSKWKLYTWELTEDTSIEAKRYEDTKSIYLEAKYPNDLVKQDQVDLSKANDLKAKVNKGAYYDEIKADLGNVDGILVKKDSYSKTYIWANKNGGKLTANFNKDNKCTSFYALVK